MNGTKYTPGPWEVVARLSGSENHRGFIVRDPKGHWIGDISPRDGDGIEGNANARLFVAAPDLDEACREAFVDISALLLATKWELAPEVRSQLESTAKKCELAFVKARGAK